VDLDASVALFSRLSQVEMEMNSSAPLNSFSLPSDRYTQKLQCIVRFHEVLMVVMILLEGDWPEKTLLKETRKIRSKAVEDYSRCFCE